MEDDADVYVGEVEADADVDATKRGLDEAIGNDDYERDRTISYRAVVKSKGGSRKKKTLPHINTTLDRPPVEVLARRIHRHHTVI